ncbi:cyclase family protein [Clostridium tyrobutyricum]|uniref:cyclase family protein n=1 Tax=Clostridium tyrobutyricum TaxID=1519 RepID=UPI002012E294|nr:cyclase family protein [Clostridium tyrobutyricum]MBR9649402.1 cyclase family protein [Clostridium tyrobutyricum]
MKIDLSFNVRKELLNKMYSYDKIVDIQKAGHIGTHFDSIDKTFSLDNTIRQGKIFDISTLNTDEVKLKDLDLSNVQENDFIIFHSGILKQYGYGSKEYFSTHIELSDELIDYLIEKKVSLIGVDMPGIKKSEKHAEIDKYCADRNIFIIENLDTLDVLLKKSSNAPFRVYTFPVNMSGFSGLPCRVIAEI